MGLLNRLFGTVNEHNYDANEEEKLALIKNHLVKHLSRVKGNGNPHKVVVDELSQTDIMNYAIEEIKNGLEESLSRDKHIYSEKRISDTHVIISTIPVERSEDAKKYFDGGYVKFLEDLFNDVTDYRSGVVNIANWICCRGAVHLTYYPALRERAIKPIIIASDLMTESEKSRIS